LQSASLPLPPQPCRPGERREWMLRVGSITREPRYFDLLSLAQ
jgi:hypothetical protein